MLKFSGLRRAYENKWFYSKRKKEIRVNYDIAYALRKNTIKKLFSTMW